MTNSNFLVSAWGDCISRIGFIVNLGIIPKFNAEMLFTTQIGFYHDGPGGEFLGKPIFTVYAFSQRMQKYIRFITIILCTQLNGKSLATVWNLSFTVQMQHSISATFYFAAEVLTTVIPINLSLVESSSISIKTVWTIVLP